MTYITAYCEKCDTDVEVESIFIGKDGYLNFHFTCKHSVTYKAETFEEMAKTQVEKEKKK